MDEERGDDEQRGDQETRYFCALGKASGIDHDCPFRVRTDAVVSVLEARARWPEIGSESDAEHDVGGNGFVARDVAEADHLVGDREEL